ncbi:MAG: hypothetical protein F4Y27_13775 [Acidimicrobiaceae bacterium]|nr:Rdx family protein [Acidimicrobiaceae bacterium]MXW63151.1 hypothetical protein [Acidimicrobiaceae bacterium]MXW77308.1 hypothetical protein [Acidimicrobiaceae bacterium]MYA75731.1 hypothetical protein [Acidimicrobiaceae bacterium]MYC41263.1 hypothetical protein [Acidimicrobiaceae bacterium]
MSAAKDLLSNYQHVIQRLTLTTGSQGVFDVTVDGDLIFSKDQAGRHDEPGEILGLFEKSVGHVSRYGQG